MRFYKKIWFWVLLFIIIAIALYAYIGFTTRDTTAQKETFTGIASSKYPVVYTRFRDKRLNSMNGYLAEMDNVSLYDTLTVLEEDRVFHGAIRKGIQNVTKLEYEIRTMDEAELIDKGEIKEIGADDGTEILFDFPIQNLLSHDKEYRFKLMLTMEDGKLLNYYTRLLWGNEKLLDEMLNLADNFSTKNFNYNTARDNTMYLESDATGDNTNLAKVDLKSNFDQLTYRGMNPMLIGRKTMRVSIYDGYMGDISIAFLIEETDENDEKHIYEVRENFSFRQGPERIYMLDYTRSMEEKFTVNSSTFAPDKINLGIHNEDSISIEKSPEGNYYAFVINRELYVLEKVKESEDKFREKLRKIYSINSDNIYPESNMKVLDVDNMGNVYFMQYGYVNNGSHEGEMGVLFGNYSTAEQKIKEPIFIPVNMYYEEIAESVESLSYMNENHIMYLKLDDDIYSIDMNTNSHSALVTDLPEHMYKISPLKNRLAWKDKNKELIYFMNLDTGITQEITRNAAISIYPRGFMDYDLILGIRTLDIGDNVELRDFDNPCNLIEIVDDNLKVQVSYTKDNHFLDNIVLDGSRIHLKVLDVNEHNKLVKVADDTIVSNTDILADDVDILKSHISEKKAKLYFLDIAQSMQVSSYSVDERSILHEDGAPLTLAGTESVKNYLSFGKGEFLGLYENVAEAVNVAYDNRGSVWNDGRLIYARVGLLPSVKLIEPAQSAESILEKKDGKQSLKLKGIGLRQALYFLKNNYYMLGISEDGTVYIIYAYDNFNISAYNTNSNATQTIGLEDATAMFEAGGNDFIAVKP